MSEHPARQSASPEPSRVGITPGVVLALISLVLFGVFIAQNRETRSVTLLGFDLELPGWLILVIVFSLGLLVGWVARARRLARKRRQIANAAG